MTRHRILEQLGLYTGFDDLDSLTNEVARDLVWLVVIFVATAVVCGLVTDWLGS